MDQVKAHFDFIISSPKFTIAFDKGKHTLFICCDSACNTFRCCNGSISSVVRRKALIIPILILIITVVKKSHVNLLTSSNSSRSHLQRPGVGRGC